MDKDELILKIKEVLKPEVTTISYDTWINPLGIRDIEKNNIIFTANSEFQKDFIENKYKNLLLNTLKYLTNRDWTFTVIDLESEAKMKEKQKYDSGDVNCKYCFRKKTKKSENRTCNLNRIVL